MEKAACPLVRLPATFTAYFCVPSVGAITCKDTVDYHEGLGIPEIS